MYKMLILLSWGVLRVSNPFLLSCLFMQALLLICLLFCSYSIFLGFVLFLVYVGGLIVILSYCIILIPSDKFDGSPYAYWPFLTFIFGADYIFTRSNTYGLLYCARAILLVTLLLLLVILSVVDILDYSGGSVKNV